MPPTFEGWMATVIDRECAGKTTLLDVLAGRKTQGEQSGRILFAGQKATRAFLKRFTGDSNCCARLHATLCAPPTPPQAAALHTESLCLAIPTLAMLWGHAGYVEQFDTLLAELSVREMLMYTAELKRPVQVRSINRCRLSAASERLLCSLFAICSHSNAPDT